MTADVYDLTMLLGPRDPITKSLEKSVKAVRRMLKTATEALAANELTAEQLAEIDAAD